MVVQRSTQKLLKFSQLKVIMRVSGKRFLILRIVIGPSTEYGSCDSSKKILCHFHLALL